MKSFVIESGFAMSDNKNEQLAKMYLQWLHDLREAAPLLLSEQYSNPYYVGIPEEWFDTDRPRILIVGEEGFGSWGCGKAGVLNDSDNPFYSAEDIQPIQSFTTNYLRTQLGLQSTSTYNKSPFWNRVRRVAKYGVCCGTCQYWCGDRELDAVNHGRIASIVSKDGKCACKRGSKYRTSVGYSKTCSEWEKWSDLR